MNALEQATEQVLAALRAEDLEALAEALTGRAELLGKGAEVTQRAWELGEAASEQLSALKQRVAFDASRLEQIRGGLAEGFVSETEAHVDYHG